jgi:hypothetical protein
MADWSTPSLTDLYTNFLSFLSNRLNDVAQMMNPNATTPTNIPTNSIRWNGPNNRFEIWSGSAWTVLLLDLTGGGTGASNASTGRANLGLGTMSVQNSNGVSITGGSISTGALVGLIPQANLGTGSDGSGNHFLTDAQTYAIVATKRPITGLSANYTVTNGDVTNHVMFLCFGGSSFTITLPLLSGITDKYDIIVKNFQTANTITVLPQGGNLIDGTTSLTVLAGANGSYFSYSLVADNADSEWWIV